MCLDTYGVRSIMASTAVCGTASLSSILSVPTKVRSPNYDTTIHIVEIVVIV